MAHQLDGADVEYIVEGELAGELPSNKFHGITPANVRGLLVKPPIPALVEVFNPWEHCHHVGLTRSDVDVLSRSQWAEILRPYYESRGWRPQFDAVPMWLVFAEYGALTDDGRGYIIAFDPSAEADYRWRTAEYTGRWRKPAWMNDYLSDFEGEPSLAFAIESL